MILDSSVFRWVLANSHLIALLPNWRRFTSFLLKPFILGKNRLLTHQKNSWRGLPYPTQQGQVGGHEGVGIIQKIGPGEAGRVKLGDRVGIKVCTCSAVHSNILFKDKSKS